MIFHLADNSMNYHALFVIFEKSNSLKLSSTAKSH